MGTDYKVLNEDVIASSKNRKHQLVDAIIITPDGKEVIWQYVKTRDVVTIVALDNRNLVYCVRQWRPARKEYVWELPAGGVEVEQPTKEQVYQNANRELQEEIGFKANKMELLSAFSPTIHMTCRYYVVLATELEKSSLPQDVDENIEIKVFPFNEAYDLLINQQLPSALTLVGMVLAKQNLK